MLPLKYRKRDGTIVACSDQPFRASEHLSVAINTFRLSNYTLICTREGKYLKRKMVQEGPNLVHMYTDTIAHYACNNESETICLFLVVLCMHFFGPNGKIS